jgi:hypothetical protein
MLSIDVYVDQSTSGFPLKMGILFTFTTLECYEIGSIYIKKDKISVII